MNQNVAPTKILVYANTQTVFARDWVNLISENKQFDFMVVCSTTGKMYGADSLPIIPVQNGNASSSSNSLISVVKKIRKMAISHNMNWFERAIDKYRLFSIKKYATQLQKHIDGFQPDIIHAMRIPYEGIIASHCRFDQPLLLSIWGNDLTLHAAQGGLKKKKIKFAIDRSFAIHADAHRDMEILWDEYNYKKSNPYLVIPASGGIDSSVLRLDITKDQAKISLGYDPDTTIICNPRGVRPYINTRLYVEACEKLVETSSKVVCILVGADLKNKKWFHSIDASNIDKNLLFTDNLNIDQFRLLLRAMDIFVSPSYHDGIPISLLEGMGSGVFPVLSNIESVTEFVRNDQQGVLFDMSDAHSLCHILENAIRTIDFNMASKENERITMEEYASVNCKPKIVDFYKEIINLSKEIK